MSPGRVDHAELFFERDDVLGKESQLEAALSRQPGVTGVAVVPHDGASIEMCVRVDFDPAVTNPVILEGALARDGFTVLSAAERPDRP